MVSFILDVIKNRSILRSQFYVNIKTTVATTKLGTLWWVLDPLLLMGIYYFVVKIIFARGGPNYHLFALCGIVCWQVFARSVNITTRSLIQSASLIKQVSVPMVLYVFVPTLVQAFFFLIGLLIIMSWNYQAIGLHTLTLIIPVFAVVLLSFLLGLFLSIFEVFMRDTSKFVSYFLQFGFYISPVLYSPDRVYSLKTIPEYVKVLYGLNPMVHIITAMREVLVNGTYFQWQPLCYLIVLEFLLIQFGLFFFRRTSLLVPKRL